MPDLTEIDDDLKDLETLEAPLLERERERARHLARLSELAMRKRSQALQVRNADSTALGEKAAENAELDASAIEWAVERLT